MSRMASLALALALAIAIPSHRDLLANASYTCRSWHQARTLALTPALTLALTLALTQALG